MKLMVNERGVFLDGQEIPNCTQVDIKNIRPLDAMEVLLHVAVDEADVRWRVME